jgi:uncharacterized coiled-coil DUF342 family protein
MLISRILPCHIEAKKLQSLLDAERVKSQKVEDRVQAAENRVAELSSLEAVLSTREQGKYQLCLLDQCSTDMTIYFEEQEGLRKEISELHDELSRTRVRADGMETQVVQLHDLRDTVTTLESRQFLSKFGQLLELTPNRTSRAQHGA